MSQFLANIPLIRELTTLVEILLFLNVILTGGVILLAFRASRYKAEAEDLESRLNEAIGTTVDQHTPTRDVTKKGRSIRY